MEAITDDTQFELPSDQGQLSFKDMKEIYPTFIKALMKKGVNYYYNLNPLSKIYDYKPSKQYEMFQLMGMQLNTLQTGEDPDPDNARPVKAKSTNMYFSPDHRVKSNATFKDVPCKGYNITATDFIEEYSELAASFDGTDAEGFLNYFFTRDKSRNSEGGAIYVLIKGDKANLFYDLLRDAEEAADAAATDK